MKRRALLAALVAGTTGLAGCGGTGDGPTGGRTTFGVPDTDARTETPTEVATTDAASTTTVRGVDPGVEPVADPSVPPTAARAVDATVPAERRLVVGHVAGRPPEGTSMTVGFVRGPDAEGPGRLWMALRNETDRERVLGFGPTPPFSGYRGRSPTSFGPDPLLVPADDRGYAQPEIVPDEPGADGCWRVDAVFVSSNVRTELALGPGEAVVGEYAFLFGHDTNGCLPEHQVYRFEDEVLDLELSVAAWAPSLAVAGESRFDRSVPALPDVAATAWYHTAEGADVYLEPRRERLSLPQGGADFLLKNFSTNPIRIDEGDWRLFKLRNGRWYRVLPWETATAPTTVPPGGQSRHLLSVDNRISYNRTGIVTGIGGGLYAVRYGSRPLIADFDSGPVRIPGDGTGGDGEDAGDEPRQAQAALLAVEGDRIGVEPDVPDDRVDRDDGTLTVDFGDGGEAVFVVRRADPDEGDPVTVIDEQANQTTALRNTVGFFQEGVQRVRFQAQPGLVDQPVERFGTAGDPLLFAHDGETYFGRVE